MIWHHPRSAHAHVDCTLRARGVVKGLQWVPSPVSPVGFGCATMGTRLDMIGVFVNGLQRMVTFYCDVLGLSMLPALSRRKCTRQ